MPTDRPVPGMDDVPTKSFLVTLFREGHERHAPLILTPGEYSLEIAFPCAPTEGGSNPPSIRIRIEEDGKPSVRIEGPILVRQHP